jgi:hypothetical protein
MGISLPKKKLMSWPEALNLTPIFHFPHHHYHYHPTRYYTDAAMGGSFITPTPSIPRGAVCLKIQTDVSRMLTGLGRRSESEGSAMLKIRALAFLLSVKHSVLHIECVAWTLHRACLTLWKRTRFFWGEGENR